MSKKPNFYASIITLLMYMFSWQVVAYESGMTFCKEDEDIYFSCSLSGGKIVSVCASGNTDPSTGYIQYRYGTPGNIEMTYPEKAIPPMGHLFLVNASEGSVNKDIIKFKNGSYTYIIAQSTVSSLSVLKNDKVVLRKSCNEGDNAFVSRAARQGIESIPKSAEDFR
ncbi:hypothetical protein K5D34_12250 [Pseudomonas cichorii]|nr:hypothetical protein [Pseudomonas cichorii]MBX8488623.1 hypothetical protein [Pseudomonas cichorii]MBX8510449.1 hypothetical protein [Pseudomonas cichorii]MBX8518763.1 hypothetical protein [Pseudomonas cichorii]MBX8523883.1 hypothetical protein [Pseudomonas cichorii]